MITDKWLSLFFFDIVQVFLLLFSINYSSRVFYSHVLVHKLLALVQHPKSKVHSRCIEKHLVCLSSDYQIRTNGYLHGSLVWLFIMTQFLPKTSLLLLTSFKLLVLATVCKISKIQLGLWHSKMIIIVDRIVATKNIEARVNDSISVQTFAMWL